jgi:hypothetical protein
MVVGAEIVLVPPDHRRPQRRPARRGRRLVHGADHRRRPQRHPLIRWSSAGDARTFTDADSSLVETRIREIAEGAALAHRASAEIIYTRVFRPTINDADCAAHALQRPRPPSVPTRSTPPAGRSPPVRTSQLRPRGSRLLRLSRCRRDHRGRDSTAAQPRLRLQRRRSSVPGSTSLLHSSPHDCPKGIDHDHDNCRLDRQRPGTVTGRVPTKMMRH